MAAARIQTVWCGFLGREIARHRFRGVVLAPAMTELIKYRHAMEDKDQLTVMRLSAVLFDQRGDSFGEGTHKGPYTMVELKTSQRTAIQLRDKRRKSIQKKKEVWTQEAAARRLEVREELKQKEQFKFEQRIEKERMKLALVENARLKEIERIRLVCSFSLFHFFTFKLKTCLGMHTKTYSLFFFFSSSS